MIDTHTHLNFHGFDQDFNEVAKQMPVLGVAGGIVVGSNLENSRKGIEIANQYPYLWAAVGLHPLHVDEMENDGELDQFETLLPGDKVVAIGEVGFDFINDLKYRPADQKKLLSWWLDAANRIKKPVIFHSRESESELLDMIAKNPPGKGGVMHCYGGSWENAKRSLDMGLMISFTGRITYPKNEDLREIVKKVPHDRVMVETDSPLLPPQSKRGKRCEPWDVIEVAEKVAELWGKDIEYVDRVTTENAKKFFKLSNTSKGKVL